MISDDAKVATYARLLERDGPKVLIERIRHNEGL
jgi:hypothetical protein